MTVEQKRIFLDTEGDRWFERNYAGDEKRAERIAHDPVIRMMRELNLSPKNVLEIGCADGWRLAALREMWPQAKFKGIDPSRQAVALAQTNIEIEQGTAEDLPYRDNTFDIVIFGFCLYLCDRADLFRIAAEADRVLSDGGRIITFDFHAPDPYRNRYVHHEGVYSYKMDYSRLFSWNPAYRVEKGRVETHPGMDHANPDNDIGTFVMRKNLEPGWPDKEKR